ncbi:wall-associated receptor kinase-like 20 [Daphnia pulicaria]|uniref:wall-associated receptor kinase-like 20 n=1 Tax=Daphnia pulicaria TaxID=35523 RepID=UPI001EEBC2F4|nr:wall-associated receptor kinase-like 20 [Daphnia pulicaria]XP_046646898.1 wall-associated receptor kinase-like 20 [Daphnia pulicaria]XP_046646899.1 wall-associated receptor kinase-like 20 [Daphnia pulicaria]
MGPPGPLRSDGCPDMRYSCNRSWASSSGSSVPLSTGGFYSSTGRSSIGGSSASPSYSSSSSAPRQSSLQLRAVAENAPARLRADGLPDMRYAANKSYVAERNMEIPLTTTSRRNSMAASASKTTSQSSTSGREYVPSRYSATSSTTTSYSNIYASPIYVPVPVSLPSQINQPEPVERLDSQERVSQLEDRLRMLELQKKIQELEISLQEAKAKQAVPSSGLKSQQVVIDKSISAAISTGARSRTSVPAKNSSTSSSISSKILNEIDHLQVRLSDVIAPTGAVVVSRRRIEKITDNHQEPIGRGGFGQVFKGTWHGRQVAVKEIRSPWRCSTVVETRSFAKMIQREVEALSAVQHRNIIGLLGLCTDNESSDGEASIRVSLIFEFANGGTLFDCLFGGQANNSKFKLDVNQMMLIARHLIEALHLLHSTQQEPGGSVMVHRDVKSANVLLQRNDEGKVVRAVLADFGLARFHSDLNESGSGSGLAASSMTAVVGTHGYVDPLYAESSQVSPSQDVYAYGVVLYEMLWKEKPETVLARRVRQSTLEKCVLQAKSVDPEDRFGSARIQLLASVGRQCVGMENRPTAKDIRKMLNVE